MNFESCIMKCVYIEDVVEVDCIFMVLMGDWVVFCWEFIEIYGIKLDLIDLDIQFFFFGNVGMVLILCLGIGVFG